MNNAKSIVLLVVTLVGFLSMFASSAQAKTKPWQNAYAAILNSKQSFYKYYGSEDQSEYNKCKKFFYFSLRDIDNNGIPELIVRWNLGADGHDQDVYTYTNEIKHLGSIRLQTEFNISGNSKFPGLFYCIDSYNGCESYGYSTIRNHKLTKFIIWQTTVKPSSDGVVYPDGESIVLKNNKTLVAVMKNAKPIPTYSISDENITDIIYNYSGKSDGALSLY